MTLHRTSASVLVSLSLLGSAGVLAQTFRAQSDLVVLQVSVHDRHSKPVPNLTKDAFRVREDGVRQEVRFFVSEDQPVAIGLVVDNSTSMTPKRADVIEAAEAFVRASNPEDALFTVNFNEHVSFGLQPPVEFTSDRAVLREALLTIGARGQTAMYDGIAVGLDRVNESPLDRRVLVVVSDGKDNRSRLSFEDVLARALRSNAAIYAVGFFDEVEGGDRPALERLAETTGGLAFFPEELRDVGRVLEQISLDVRHRYTIGYSSTNPKRDGTFRKVTVTAIDPDGGHQLRVHARSGYVASELNSDR